LWNT